MKPVVAEDEVEDAEEDGPLVDVDDDDDVDVVGLGRLVAEVTLIEGTKLAAAPGRDEGNDPALLP